METVERLRQQGCEVDICGLPVSVLRMIRRSGLYDQMGKAHYYRGTDQALYVLLEPALISKYKEINIKIRQDRFPILPDFKK